MLTVKELLDANFAHKLASVADNKYPDKKIPIKKQNPASNAEKIELARSLIWNAQKSLASARDLLPTERSRAEANAARIGLESANGLLREVEDFLRRQKPKADRSPRAHFNRFQTYARIPFPENGGYRQYAGHHGVQKRTMGNLGSLTTHCPSVSAAPNPKRQR